MSAADTAVQGTQFSAGDLVGDSFEALSASVEKLNAERSLGHIPNVDLVAGDFMVTCDHYLEAHPHLLVALLYLYFDLYEPTKHALYRLLPLMPRGAMVCFDELNCESFPGETQAFLEEPRLALDNNATERALRGMVIGRKNHYGSRSKRGTEVAALFYSLIESAKLCGVEPKATTRWR